MGDLKTDIFGGSTSDLVDQNLLRWPPGIFNFSWSSLCDFGYWVSCSLETIALFCLILQREAMDTLSAPCLSGRLLHPPIHCSLVYFFKQLLGLLVCKVFCWALGNAENKTWLQTLQGAQCGGADRQTSSSQRQGAMIWMNRTLGTQGDSWGGKGSETLDSEAVDWYLYWNGKRGRRNSTGRGPEPRHKLHWFYLRLTETNSILTESILGLFWLFHEWLSLFLKRLWDAPWPGRVQLVRALSLWAKVAGSIPGLDSHAKINQWTHKWVEQLVDVSLPLSLCQKKKKKKDYEMLKCRNYAFHFFLTHVRPA